MARRIIVSQVEQASINQIQTELDFREFDFAYEEDISKGVEDELLIWTMDFDSSKVANNCFKFLNKVEFRQTKGAVEIKIMNPDSVVASVIPVPPIPESLTRNSDEFTPPQDRTSEDDSLEVDLKKLRKPRQFLRKKRKKKPTKPVKRSWKERLALEEEEKLERSANLYWDRTKRGAPEVVDFSFPPGADAETIGENMLQAAKDENKSTEYLIPQLKAGKSFRVCSNRSFPEGTEFDDVYDFALTLSPEGARVNCRECRKIGKTPVEGDHMTAKHSLFFTGEGELITALNYDLTTRSDRKRGNLAQVSEVGKLIQSYVWYLKIPEEMAGRFVGRVNNGSWTSEECRDASLAFAIKHHIKRKGTKRRRSETRSQWNPPRNPRPRRNYFQPRYTDQQEEEENAFFDVTDFLDTGY